MCINSLFLTIVGANVNGVLTKSAYASDIFLRAITVVIVKHANKARPPSSMSLFSVRLVGIP